ncbi:MAG: type II toxin-antitoxin system RelE/ParE family toxin [Nanoarchaeota archaeon]
MFSAELKKPALKFLKSIKDKTLLKRLSDRINELEKNPFPQDIERVEGYKDIKVFRVRVGDYRILYFVNYTSSKVYIEKIDKRSRIYR